ncbi:MAG: hypothetical protein R6V05_11945 [Candidatus Brocadiia bacterium]
METEYVLGVAALALLALGLWMACPAYVYVDAVRRRVVHPVLWAFGAFWFGPLGLIAYLVDRPPSVRVKCRNCRQSILITDRECPYCGHRQ